MPTTVGRSRGRQGVHSGAQGATGDHMRKIMATLITAIVILIAVLVLTKAGRDIDAATQRFMLYYAGVLALVGLTGSVLLGLVATDRIVMTPGHRVMAQAVHRAFSFGTLAFLIIHIVTEILAQRSHVIERGHPLSVAVPDLLHRARYDRLRSHRPARGNEHLAQAVHRTRKSLALAGHPLRLLRRVRVRGPARPARRPDGQAVRRLELRVRDRGNRSRSRGQVPGHLAAAEGKPAVVSQRRSGQARWLVTAARRGSGPGAGPAGQHHRQYRAGAARWPGRPGRRGLVGRAARAGPVTGLRPAAGPGSRPGLRRAARRRLPRPRLHAARRAAVRRRWPGRNAGPSLRVRGPGAPGAGRPRPATALRARVRRTASVRRRAEGTRRHTPGRAVLLSVRTGGPRRAARAAVPRGLSRPSRCRTARHQARRA